MLNRLSFKVGRVKPGTIYIPIKVRVQISVFVSWENIFTLHFLKNSA